MLSGSAAPTGPRVSSTRSGVAERVVQQRGVVERAQQGSVRRDHDAIAGPTGGAILTGPLLEPVDGGRGGPARAGEADRVDPLGGEPVEPRVVALHVVGRGREARVGQPHLDVRRGSTSSRCRTHASSGCPSSQPPGRRASPRRHGGPSWRGSGTTRRRSGGSPRSRPGGARRCRRASRSRGRPAPRCRAGRSRTAGSSHDEVERLPATGSNRLPSRTSTVTSLSRAVRDAIARARGLTSVATTSRACWARCIACTPQPVPMSRARPTGSRTVSFARATTTPR